MCCISQVFVVMQMPDYPQLQWLKKKNTQAFVLCSWVYGLETAQQGWLLSFRHQLQVGFRSVPHSKARQSGICPVHEGGQKVGKGHLETHNAY